MNGSVGILTSLRSSYMRAISRVIVQQVRAAGYRPVVQSGLLPHLPVIGYVGFFNPDSLAQLQAQRTPAVNISQMLEELPLPSVLPDNIAAGRLAAEHLIAQGHQQLFFLPYAGTCFSRLRAQGAREAAAAAGVAYTEWSAEQLLDWDSGGARLPRPAGVVAADDSVAVRFLEEAHRRGVPVPDHLAVVGITNEEFACTTAAVALSSVDLNPTEIGEHAAALLLRLIAGHRPPRKPLLVPPHGVVVRTSSDALATSDPLIANITRHAREHLGDGVFVEDLARKFGMSRRNLTRLCRERAGMSPSQLLQRLTVERAKHLLLNTRLSILQVAGQCGYDNLSHFNLLFRRLAGISPAQYRHPGTTSLGRPAR